MVVFDKTTLELAEEGDDMVCLEIQGIDSIRITGTLSVDVVLTLAASTAEPAGTYTITYT